MEAEESNFINSKNKFGTKKLEEVKDTELNRAELLEKQKQTLNAARRLVAVQPEAPVEEEIAPKSSKKSKAAQAVTFNIDTDLKDFNTTTKSLIKSSKEEVESGEEDPEEAIQRGLFVTAQDADEAMDEFE